MSTLSPRHLARAAFAAALSVLLTGCLLSPGKFTSDLTLMKDGTFSYAYKGEIQMLAFSKLAEMGAKAEDEFEAEDCYDEDTYEDRECTAGEIAEQKAEWEASAEERRAKKAKQAEQMKAFLGGIDPSSPEAAQELADRLSRQRGWNSVTHRGDGLFDVDFAISGTLSHDFAFPTIERMPMGNSFVTVILRDDGKVRVDATGFAAQGAGNPWQGMMSGMMGIAQMESGEGSPDGKMPKLVVPEGSFTLRTDGEILANNTDEGPVSHATGQALTWQIGPGMKQAPTALIGF